MSQSLEELKTEAAEELTDWLKENPDCKDEPHDTISEIADSSTPIYTHDLLQLGSDNWDLMTSEPQIGPAFDGKPTPINIIAANIYEAISAHLFQTAQNWTPVADCSECDDETDLDEMIEMECGTMVCDLDGECESIHVLYCEECKALEVESV
jgi:hypothetical protein